MIFSPLPGTKYNILLIFCPPNLGHSRGVVVDSRDSRGDSRGIVVDSRDSRGGSRGIVENSRDSRGGGGGWQKGHFSVKRGQNLRLALGKDQKL